MPPMINRDSRWKHLDGCSQEAAIKSIEASLNNNEKTLAEMKEIQARIVTALEDIARQGATIISMDKRMDKAEKCFENLFPRIVEIEKWIANQKGRDERLDEERKWWNSLKAKLAPQSVAIILFIVYVVDQFDVSSHILTAWKVFTK